MSSRHKIAIWMSDKKSQKYNWALFQATCLSHNLEIFKLDLNKCIYTQDSFSIFLHKLTDVIASADQGDAHSLQLLRNVESYLLSHPEIIVIDPIKNIRQLIDRFESYSIITKTELNNHNVFTPTFCKIVSTNTARTAFDLAKAKVTYPFICKPKLGHGSKKAHKMLIVFNENHLKDCKPPCVAQSFVNHHAILHKIFVIGDQHYYVERPSIKNLYPSDQASIYFDSGDISKATSQSTLSILDSNDLCKDKIKPDTDTLEVIVKTVRSTFGLDLIGIDVVIDKDTGHYAIIDINVFPGYDGFPDYFETLVQFLKMKINCKLHDECMSSKEYKCVQLNSITLAGELINR